MKRGRKISTIESLALTSLPCGSIFFSQKKDKELTAIASYYNIKIKTERLININPITIETQKITKVTIL